MIVAGDLGRRDVRETLADGLSEPIEVTGRHLSEMRLQLQKGQFNRIEIRGIGGQKAQVGARRLNCGSGIGMLMYTRTTVVPGRNVGTNHSKIH